MKKFDLKEFNVHGTKFKSIRLKFDYKKGFTELSRDKHVSVKPNVIPCAGCDFIGGPMVNDGIILINSLSSDNFFEVIKPSMLKMTDQWGYAEVSAYCLVENFDEVLVAMKDTLNTYLAAKVKIKQEEVEAINLYLSTL